MPNPAHHRIPWHSGARQVDFHARTVAFIVPSAWNALPLGNPTSCSLTSSRSLLTCHRSRSLSLIILNKIITSTYIHLFSWSGNIFLHSAGHPWLFTHHEVYEMRDLVGFVLSQTPPIVFRSMAGAQKTFAEGQSGARPFTHIANMHRYPPRWALAPLYYLWYKLRSHSQHVRFQASESYLPVSKSSVTGQRPHSQEHKRFYI